MQDFKKRLYDFEEVPPEGVWKKIYKKINEEKKKVVPFNQFRKKSKLYFYFFTAAGSLVIIFAGTFLSNKSTENSKGNSGISLAGKSQNSSAENTDSIDQHYEMPENIINAKKDENLLAHTLEKSYKNGKKKYMTIAGPEGKPVKISSKVATLIESTDKEFPPRQVWNDQIAKWKQIMLNSTASPTSGDLVDILALSPSINNNQ
jgi:hypothetical protein